MESTKTTSVHTDNAQKNKALELAVQAIEKQFGKGSIMRLGEGENLIANDVPVVPTGSLSLDLALGIGGLPRGRIAEIYGPEASGSVVTKTTAFTSSKKLKHSFRDPVRAGRPLRYTGMDR